MSKIFNAFKVTAIIMLMPVVLPLVFFKSQFKKLTLKNEVEDFNIISRKCHKCGVIDPGPTGWWCSEPLMDNEKYCPLLCQECFESSISKDTSELSQ